MKAFYALCFKIFLVVESFKCIQKDDGTDDDDNNIEIK